MGPSPRVRGKPGQWHAEGQRGRLIPARAGKTYRSHEHFTRNRAHPRACGENGPEHRRMLTWLGSSPRVRGKRPLGPQGQGVDGLIPARAGKTLGVQRGANPGGAHPRACGENRPTMRLRITQVGSSPRVRGKHAYIGKIKGFTGLIPARAGKTWPQQEGRGVVPAHPRACGENRREGPVRPRLARLIPARAGKTFVESHGYSGSS